MQKNLPLVSLLGLVFLIYLALAAWLGIGLRFEFLRSDVQAYWQDSQTWGASFDTFHVPGYPFLIAFLRWISLDSLPPLAYLMVINLVAYLAGTALCYATVANLLPGGRPYAVFAALAYAVWPFVGVVYVVYPIADALAMSLVLGGIFFLTRERPLPGAFLLGLAVIAHKATWPVAGLVFLGYLISVRSKLSLKTVGAGLLLIGPLGLIWLLGLARHGDALWILTSNLETELAPRGSFPVLDGILGAFAGGGMAGMFKGLVVLGFAGLALGLLVGVWTQANLPYRTLWLGLGVAVLALFLVLNRYEIWAAVRFSRLLAVPLALALPPVWQRLPGKKLLLAGAGCLALITQAAYAWYMARVFFD